MKSAAAAAALLVFVGGALIVIQEVVRERETFQARLAAVEGYAFDVDLALAEHEHDAEQHRRMTWELLPARTRRELVEAVVLRTNRSDPVIVQLIDEDDGGRP